MEPFIDTGFDVFFGVALGKFIETEKFAALWCYGRVLPVSFHSIPHILEIFIEVIQRFRKFDGTIDVGVYDIVNGGVGGVVPMVLFWVGMVASFLWFGHHGELILFAELVRQLADAVVILRVRFVVLVTIHTGD